MTSLVRQVEPYVGDLKRLSAMLRGKTSRGAFQNSASGKKYWARLRIRNTPDGGGRSSFQVVNYCGGACFVLGGFIPIAASGEESGALHRFHRYSRNDNAEQI